MPRQNDLQPFDHATMEQLMERYRSELIGYQRATAPGRPTLAESLREVTESRVIIEPSNPALVPKEEPVLYTEPVPCAEPEPVPEAVPPTLPQEESIPKEYLTPPIPAPAVDAPPVLCAEEEKSRILAESLLEISEARVLRPPCSCAEGAALQEQFAPTRHRTLLPAALPELPPCGCHTPQEPMPSDEVDPTWPDYGPAIPAQSPAPVATMLLAEASAAPFLAPETVSAPEALPMATPQPSPSTTLPTTSGCCGHTEYEKCVGALGTFFPYESLERYTTAPFLRSQGEPTPVIVRFAADLLPGAADAMRCRRSFSVRFLGQEEAVLPGQHLPVTVGCDEACLAACSMTTRPRPSTGLRSREQFWEFLIAHPEALHAALHLYSDLGTIGSYRAIDGYCPPMLWENAKGEQSVVRCCWLSRQRPQTLTRFEAEELCGADPDAVSRDLIQAITAGDRPQYELAVQLLPEGKSIAFDPFDPTCIWPQGQAALRRIGLLTLERLPQNPQEELFSERFAARSSKGMLLAAPQSAGGFFQAGEWLNGLGEQERRRLVENLCDELLRLPAALLEETLILVSKANLGFGQALTAALGG